MIAVCWVLNPKPESHPHLNNHRPTHHHPTHNPPPQVSDAFPYEWIKKKWREEFSVTAIATAGSQWAVVMSRGAGLAAQVVELDFQ